LETETAQLPVETGDKKHIVAERSLDGNISSNLSNLFISNVLEYKVCSLYSALTKKLIAYKVFNSDDNQKDDWMNFSQFNQVFFLDYNTDFKMVPKAFSLSNQELDLDFNILYNREKEHFHLLEAVALDAKNLFDNQDALFAFINKQTLCVAVFKNNTCVFANSFNYSDQAEILYFMMNALKVNNIKQEECLLLMDSSLSQLTGFKEFVQVYFNTSLTLSIPFSNPDPEMSDLEILLMPNHLLSLCV
jgi:hypothetical protein